MDEAIRQFQEAIRLKPDHAEAHYNLGTALDSKGQTDEAIPQYQEATRLNPGNADAHYNLGLALASKGQTEEAIRRFEAALKVKPDYPEAHNHLGHGPRPERPNGRGDPPVPGSPETQAGLCRRPQEPGRRACHQSPALPAARRCHQPLSLFALVTAVIAATKGLR